LVEGVVLLILTALEPVLKLGCWAYPIRFAHPKMTNVCHREKLAFFLCEEIIYLGLKYRENEDGKFPGARRNFSVPEVKVPKK